MDTTIRNLDDAIYRAAKARAALTGRTIGDIVNDALRLYVARPLPQGGGRLLNLRPETYPAGTERLSEEIDALVYGGGA